MTDIFDDDKDQDNNSKDMFSGLTGDFDEDINEIVNPDILGRLGNRNSNSRNNNDGNNTDDDVEDYADQLIEYYIPKTLRDTKEIYRYDKGRGIFVGNAETILEERIEADKGRPYYDEMGILKESKLSTGKVHEYLNHIRRRTYIDRDDFNPNIEWLACENCMINLLTGETREFDPSFLCSTQIPVIYDHYLGNGQIADFFRLAEDRRDDLEGRGKIIKFLYEVVAQDDVETILDFMAYCLWRAYRFNFWMLFYGAGFNGKSILLTLIERFLGKRNVSGETLDRLLHERFAVGNLFNKMANIDADVSADVIFNNTGIIKKLTGNDLHTGEYKFKDPFKFVNYAKLIFSCNRIPDTDDKTDAFFRRVLVINFTQQFFGDKDDPYLIEKLCTNEEFTLLLQYELLPRLIRIMREGGLKKVTNEAIEQTHDRYARGSDPVKYFFEKALEANPGNKVRKVDLCEHFDKFCKYFGFAPESDYSLSRKLKEDFHLQYKRTSVKGEAYYYWKDIGLKNWQEAEQKEEEENRLDFFSKAVNATSDEELK